MNCIPNRLVFLSLVISSRLNATAINAPADHTTIQADLTAADPSDTVFVQHATDYENIIRPNGNGIKLLGAVISNTYFDAATKMIH